MRFPMAYWVKSKRIWFAVLTLVLGAAGVGVYTSVHTIKNLSVLESRLANTQAKLGLVEQLYTHLLALESAQRGFLLTRDQEYLLNYEDTRQTLSDLRQTIAKRQDDLQQDETLSSLLAYTDLKRDEIENSVSLLQTGDSQLARESLDNYEALLLFSNVQRYYQLYRSAQIQRLSQLQGSLDKGRQASKTTFVVSSFITTLLVILLLGVIYLSIRLYQQQQQNQNEAKDRFLAHLSHELRTPLSSILGYSELLLASETHTTSRATLSTIVRNARHLQSLLNDLLDVSKLVAGKLMLSPTQTQVHELLDEVYASLHVAAEDKGLNLVFTSLEPLPLHAHIDATRVKQVLINLINNAIKFTEQGQITLEISATAPNQLAFSVIDTGCGIPRDKVDSIFQPFEQVTTNRVAFNQGVGLGLAICYQLVTRMGGTIEIDSNNKGSRFHFSVICSSDFAEPKKHYHVGETTAVPLAKQSQTLTGTVLVVDDNADIRRLLSSQLEQMGLNVHLAQSGQHALDLLEDTPCDLVLMDLNMPDMSGQACYTALREERFAMPVVAVTAGLTEGMEPQLLKIGFDAVLSKPVTNQTLQELCARFCQPHVLLIEDDQDSGELLSLLLSTKNVRCTHVTTGKQAFDVIESTHITHVISDLNLPDCNGLSLVGELVKRNNTLTAYLVSGNQLHPKDIPRNLVKGAFVKPINDADINKILAKESNYQTG